MGCMGLGIYSQGQAMESIPAQEPHQHKSKCITLKGVEQLYFSGIEDASAKFVHKAALREKRNIRVTNITPVQLNKEKSGSDNSQMQPIRIVNPVSNEGSYTTKQLIAFFEKGAKNGNNENRAAKNHTTDAKPPVTGAHFSRLRSKFERLSNSNETKQPLIKPSEAAVKPSSEVTTASSPLPLREGTGLEQEEPMPDSVKDLLKRSKDQNMNPFALLLEDFENELNATKPRTNKARNKAEKTKEKIALTSNQEVGELKIEPQITDLVSQKALINAIAKNQKENKSSASELKTLEAAIDIGRNKSGALHNAYKSNEKEIKKHLSFIKKVDDANPILKKCLDKINHYDQHDNLDGIIRYQIKMLKVINTASKDEELKDFISLIQEGADLLESQDEKEEFINEQSEIITLRSTQIENKKNQYTRKIKDLMAENKAIYEQTRRAELEAIQHSSRNNSELKEYDNQPVSAEELEAHKLHCEKMLHEIEKKDKLVSAKMALNWTALKDKIQKNHQARVQ